MVYQYSGFIRYSSECLRCHGPDGMGSSYAPALMDSLKRLSYSDFYAIVAGGKKDVSASQDLVMPANGANKNVMCFIDAIYSICGHARMARLGGDVRKSTHRSPSLFTRPRTNAWVDRRAGNVMAG